MVQPTDVIDIKPDVIIGEDYDTATKVTSSIVQTGGTNSPMSSAFQSPNFASGSVGWRLTSSGDLEANTGTFRGALAAASGTIGGFKIGSDYVKDVADSMGLASTVASTSTNIDSYSETNSNASLGMSNNIFKVGQVFTGQGILTSCKFYLSKVGTPTGNAVAKLYAITGTFGTNATPTGSALATSDNFDVSTLTGSNQLITFTFSGANQYSMATGTKYAIEFSYTGTVTDSIFIGEDTTSPTHNGNFFQNTGSYSSSATSDLIFYVTATITDDVRFWAGDTYANRTSADFRVTESGAVTASSMTITGGSISGAPISSIPNTTETDISILESTHNLVFSVTDKDTVAWASGTITLSNGRTFSISAGNTGNMAARTYIYLDTTVSVTVLQQTTTVSSAVGANKNLIAVCQNGNAQAQYTVYGGIGGIKLPASGTSVSNNNWTYSGTWSVTNATTIAWGAGTLTTSDGGSYSISGSNTGVMAAKNYIYFDLGTSSTDFQTTTTASTSIGDGKILIAIAQNGTNEANFLVVNDKQSNIDAAQIVAGSITANEIAASTITAAKLTVSQLSSITADMGAITAGTIVLPSSGFIRSGQTAFNTGTGFYLGNDSGTPKFSIGIGGATTNNLNWDGSNLTINGYVIQSKGSFGGDGSDGALTISSGTTTIDLASATLLVKNYSSISITGTGKLAFSNPHTNGTVIVLKTTGNVTLTSSTAPMLDASSLGADGGSGDGATGSNGNLFLNWLTNGGQGGSTVSGNGGAVPTNTTYPSTNFNNIFSKYPGVFVGAGGGSGGRNGGTSGNGGKGGGALTIECAGALNFTTASGISVGGAVGQNSAGGNNGGGGGGGGGFFNMLYNTLTANSGTITIAGGAGGSGSGSGGNDAGGGGGGSYVAGSNKSGINGGAGGTGISFVAQNTTYS